MTMATARRATTQWDTTTAMMATGDDDNDVDGDSATGNEVDDDGDGATATTTTTMTTMATTRCHCAATANALRCRAALPLPCEDNTALLRCAAAANALRCRCCAAAPCTAAAALPVDDRSTITTRSTTISAADPRSPPLFLEESKEEWRRYFISRSGDMMDSSRRFLPNRVDQFLLGYA